jgi:hypothetical protein
VTRFLAVPVAGVATGIALASIFCIPKMGVEFGFQGSFNHCLAQFFEQAIFSQDVLRILRLFEQFINQFSSDGHF